MKYKKIIISIGVLTLLIGLCISSYIFFSNKRESKDILNNSVEENINNDVETKPKEENESNEKDPIENKNTEEELKQEDIKNEDSNKQTNSTTTNTNNNNSKNTTNNDSNKVETDSEVTNDKETNTNNNEKLETSIDNSEKEENSDNSQESNDSTTQNKKTKWEELGLTEDEYYNKPMIKSQKVTHATMSDCQAAGKKATEVIYDEDGNSHQDYSGFWCTDVLSSSGNYLGSMLSLF